MKTLFTKGFYIVSAIILFVGIALPARAQFTSITLSTNALATALAKDASGNIYALQTDASGTQGEVVKYTNGTGSPTVIYDGFPDNDNAGDYGTGLIVTSNGDVYLTTDNDGPTVPYGNIIKLKFNGGTSYTASVYQTGTASVGYYSALAVDASDNIYAVVYNVNADGGNSGIGAYEVVKYAAGSAANSAGTVLYDKLDAAGLLSGDYYTAPSGLTVNSLGDVYVADSFDNDNANNDGGHIYKLTKATSYAVSTISTNQYVTSLAVDASNNLYATQVNSFPGYALVRYTGDTGTPTTIYTGLSSDGSDFPYGLAIINPTNIYVNDGGTNGGTDNQGNIIQLIGTPATQATNVTFTNTTTTGTTASWTNGSGASRAVFIALASTGSPAPVNSTTYTANTTYASGTQVGGSGWYCVYNGTGSTVNITGLTAGNTYRVMAVEYNGPAGSQNYLTTAGTNNPNNVTPVSLTAISSINLVTASPTNATSVQYTVTFGAAITGLTTSNFSLTTTGGISGASISSIAGSGTTYTVTANTGTGDGTIALSLANATSLSPGISTTLPFAGQAYTIDKTAPTANGLIYASNNTTNSAFAKIGNTITLTFGSSETVQTPTVTIAGHTITATSTGVNSYLASYTMVAGDAEGRIPFTLSLTDPAGNQTTYNDVAAGDDITFDKTAPTITIGSPSVSSTSTGPVTYTVTYADVNFNTSTLVAGNVSLITTGTATGTVAVTGSGTTYTVSITSISGTGTLGISIGAGTASDLAGNLAPGSGPSATFIVAPALIPQTITFNPLPTKTYGNADFAPGATSTNNGTPAITYSSDNTAVATIVSGNIHIVAAGTAHITASQAGDGTHSAATDVTQSLTVNQAPLTITATNQSSTYGAALPALTVSYSGFVNGDTQASLTTAATASTTATAASPANTYVINASGAVDPNYIITYVPGTLTIGKAALTVTADNQSSTYGAALPALTVTYSGFVNGDTQASLTTAATASTTATAASPAGNYSINTSGAVDPNYTISYVPGTLTIGKAALTITADNQSSTYGAALPTLTASYTGFVNGDTQASLTTAPTLTTTATTASPANTYSITASGAVDPNYTITYVAGTLTIGKATLTVTADNQSSTYGAALPALTVTYSGFVNGDTQASLTTAATASTTATAASPAGNYSINTSGAVDPNYTITYVPGTLTIGKAALTVTADNQSSTYGAALPALTVTYSGFVNGDTQASLTTAATANTTATAASPAGNYSINTSGAVDPNYTISYVAGTLTIGKANLTITADNQSITHGATIPTLTASYSGFVNGDNAASLTTAPTLTTTGTSASPAGSYPINASGAVDPNYNISYVAGTLAIGKTLLVVTVNDQSSVYGSALPTFTVSYSGFVNGDNAASLTTPPTISTTATAASPAGSYPITASGAVDPNYAISYTPGTLTISKAALTVTADNQSSTYGAALPALTVTYSGFVNGDTQASLTAAATASTTATAASPAGNYSINTSGAVDPNYTISYVPGTLTIGKAALTVTADNQSSTYGAALPTLTVTYSGFVNGDTQASLTTAATASTIATAASPAGNYSINTSGAVDPNYTISYVAGTLTIGKANLTITADNQNIAHGAAIPTLTASYSGFVNGDNAASLTTAPTLSTTATSASSAGNYPITASGAVDPNYNISYVAGTLAIGKALLTITVNNQNLVYGSVLPTLTANYSGFVNGDNIASLTSLPTITTTATAASPVGTYTITASGAADPNYNINYVLGTLTIDKAPLTITADNQSSTYGAALPTLTTSYSGFVNGDNAASLTTAPTLSTTATSASPAGSYPITASGAVDPNYTITYAAGTLTIGKAALTVTADNQSSIYGSALPALTASYSGFVNGDNTASLTTAPTLTTTGTASSPAGSYPIMASGAVDPNYTISYVAGTLTIGKANLTITADNQSIAHGAAIPVLTASYSGFVNGDNVASLTTAPTLSTTGTSASSAGSYPIIANGAVDPNYNISYVAGTLAIGKALLVVTVDNQSSVYGSALPTLTVSYSGFVNGDNAASLATQPTISTTATAASPAGTYAITASGAVDPNYAISYTPGTLTISKAALTVTADNQSSTYGAVLPTLTASYSGFVNGDNAASLTTAPIITTSATAASPAGSYPITASGAIDPNYTISYVAGTLTISKAALTVTADNQSSTYGSALPALTVSYAGFVNGDNAASLTTAPILTTTGTASSPAGSYPITASGAVDANYTISYVAGSLTIGKANLTITADNQSIAHGAAIPTLTASYSGFVNGDNLASLTTAPTLTTTGTSASSAGSYPITASGAVDPNYNISYVAGTLAIGKALLTITVDNQTSVYGSALPTLTVSYSGFVNGDNAASLTTAPTISTAATAASPAGAYPINASGAVDPNYTFVYVPGTLTISKAALTVTADNQSSTYGTALPTLTASYSGFVNGDNAASLTTAATTSTTATSASPAGSYPITASGAVDPNYTITYAAGTLTIGKAALTITADNQSSTYGSALPALTASYTGFVNGDNAASLTTAPTLITTGTASSPAGSYPITASGAVDANYTISYVAGSLTIGKANLTITADNQSIIHGAAIPALTASYNGFVNGDNVASLTTAPTVTTTGTSASPAGNYPITASGAVDPNYNISYVAGTLAIGKSALVVTVNNQTSTYGSAIPALTVSYAGFVNGDNASSLTTAPIITTTGTASSPAGIYPISASGAVDPNYNITYVAGTLTIGQAALTITADNQSSVYGGAIPALTASYSGFVNGDNTASLTTAPAITTAGTSSSPAGTYTITASGAVDANYAITYIAGTLTIGKVPLTITANDQTTTYGLPLPTFTATYTGFVNGDNAASLTTAPSITTTATSTSPVGTYPITASSAVDANYSISYVAGTLTVKQAVRTLTFNALPVETYGSPDFDPGAVASDGETVLYTSSNPAAATIVNGKIHITGAGSTLITATLATNPNYTTTPTASQGLVINKANQTISVLSIPTLIKGTQYDLSVITSSSGLPLTFTVSDPTIASVNGQTLNALHIGSTSLTVSQPGDNNYNAASTTGAIITVTDNAGDEIIVHQAVSPNGDGINDFFLIEGIKNYPDNQVTIVNRNGVKVYQTRSYDNAYRVFDGRSNITGTLQQAGTYFYLLEYTVNGESKRKTGFLVLKYQ